MPSAYVLPDTAARRPLISTSRITQIVATIIAQTRPRPKFAPAAADVASAPASMKPPVAVRMPSVRPRTFFMQSALDRLLELLVACLPELQQRDAFRDLGERDFRLRHLESPLRLAVNERARIKSRRRE